LPRPALSFMTIDPYSLMILSLRLQKSSCQILRKHRKEKLELLEMLNTR
jgi:hypothetical protein